MLKSFVVIVMFAASVNMYSQPNGSFQMHFIDVGQGDAALLITPGGKTVLFDNGVEGKCDELVAYLDRISIEVIDYHIVSHYHADHIGCTTQVLTEYPLVTTSFDRGEEYNSNVFKSYTSIVGSKRKTVELGQSLTIDEVKIDFVAANARTNERVIVTTSNENDQSVVCVVHYGNLDIVMAGDLSGYKTGSYEDIETDVAPLIGQVEIYKVNHHCSAYSSNDTWLETLSPKIGIVSVGDGNSYRHPTEECLERLHSFNIKTFWTETGNGGEPSPEYDIVVGDMKIESDAIGDSFTLNYGSESIPYATWESDSGSSATEPELKFAWSKKSNVYHHKDCRFVKNISDANYQAGNSPPDGKRLHEGCPR